MNRDFVLGVVFTLLGGVFWGLSGTCAQFIQEMRHVDAKWLVTSRLTIAGLISLSYNFYAKRDSLMRLFLCSKDIFHTMIFGVFGMALCQYSYFVSIYYAGAGIATVLQYLAPTIIILYYLLFKRKWPSKGESISVVIAMTGTILIATKGELSLDRIDGTVLFWGILSAVAVAIYSAQPIPLLRKYGSGPIVSVGMLFGALTGILLWQPFYVPGEWDSLTHTSYWIIILLGTVVSFNLYIEGVKRIGAVKGSILSSVEPISAVIFSWALLGNAFSLTDVIGFTMILATVFILSAHKGAS